MDFGDAGPRSPDDTDPFDTSDFNVIHFLNSRFPNEESLVQLEPTINVLNRKVRRVDAQILGAVHQQSSSGGRAREDLMASKASIAELLTQVSDIRRKAAVSETLVHDICRDIKKLDTAKKHLTTTITGLRRLAMLSSAMDQLQLAVERHQYSDAAHLVGAVQQLLADFRDCVNVPRVQELRTRLAALETSLRLSSLREFELLGEEPPSSALLDRLRSCCAAAAALGPGARDELMDAVCRREMGVYTQIFGTVGETARLDRTVNRYKWLLRRLEQRKEVWAIFPPEWRLQQLLCVTFCSITKTALAEILDERAAELPHQVEALLKAVEATHIFEAEMARRFEEGADPKHPGASEVANADAHRHAAESDDDATAGSGADAARRRHARRKALAAAADAGADPEASPSPQLGPDAAGDRAVQQQQAAAEAVARALFRGAISPVFYPYLQLYVDQVERELQWSVDQIIQGEAWVGMSPDQRILRSSNELTDAIRGEVRDCCARVSRGATLLDLAAVFQRVYSAYAARLVARLPKTTAGGSAGAAVLGTTDWQVKLGEGDVELVCLLVATAQHCGEMVRQLARALEARLEPALAARVDFSQEEDEFAAVVAQCLSVLLLGIETRVEAGLAALMKLNWAALEVAGDQSEYVGLVRSALADVGPRAGDALAPNEFRFLCDRLVRSMAPRLTEAVLRCRRLSDAGCQQLRLDVEAIKGALTAFAHAGPAAEDAAAWMQRFSADVNSQMGRVEAVLKVVPSPVGALVETCLELLPHTTPAEFLRIVELKGLKRLELAAVQDEYNRRTGRGGGGGSAGVGHVAPAAEGQAVAVGALPGAPGLLPAGKIGADVAARFKPINMMAARASAAAASDSMRETMGAMKSAMRGFRFGKQQQ